MQEASLQLAALARFSARVCRLLRHLQVQACSAQCSFYEESGTQQRPQHGSTGGFFGCSAARIEVVAGWQKTWSTMMARLPWWLHLSNSRAFLPVHRQREPRETGDWLRHKLHSPIHLPPLVARLPSRLLLLTKGSIVYTSHVHGYDHRVTRHLDECFFPVRRRPHAPTLQLASIQKNQRAPDAASLWV